MKDHGNTLAQTLITDKTVVSDTARAGEDTQPITVSWLADGQKQSAEFSGSVTIGRDAACEICMLAIDLPPPQGCRGVFAPPRDRTALISDINSGFVKCKHARSRSRVRANRRRAFS